MIRAALLVALLAGCAEPREPAAPVAARPGLVASPLGPAAEPQRDLLVTVRAATGDPAAAPAILRALAAEHAVELVFDWSIGPLGIICGVFRAASPNAAPALRARLEADPRVERVQPLQLFETSATGWNDPFFPLQDAAGQLNLAAAHDRATGAGVRVGLIDTGVAFEHEDLRGRVVSARDFVAPAPGRPPPERHGTGVAGVIGAAAGNQRGIVGVAPGAALVGLRGCWEDAPGGPGRCSTVSLARALGAAINERVDVLNLSLRGPADPLLARIVAAAQATGIVVVAAWDPAAPEGFPAALPQVLRAVAAGPIPPAEAIAAPGQAVLTTVPEGYDVLSGSSIAAAHVSGLVALLRELRPGLPAEASRGALLEAGRGRGGIPDACALLATARPGELGCARVNPRARPGD